MDLKSFFCEWWPVAATWPSVSPCIIWWSWGRGCVLALLVVSWVGGFLNSAIQLSTVYGLPFCGPNVTEHSLWQVPFTETRLYWHLCHWHLNCGQWRTDLHYCVSALTRLLWTHPALSEEPESGREAESPPDLWFPHHCGCLLLWSLYFHVCKTC